MTSPDSIERLDSAMGAFLVPLRMGEGFQSEKFEAVCLALKEFTSEWQRQQVIPKAAAILLFDAHAAMVASSYLYPSQTSNIQEKADTLAELVRTCCE